MGLDLAFWTNKRDFFSYGLEVTTIVQLDWSIKKATEVLTGEQLIWLVFGGDRR